MTKDGKLLQVKTFLLKDDGASANVPLPESDPSQGKEGPLQKYWPG